MVREKIRASHIVRRFQLAFDGEIVLTREQIDIGKTLLGKSLPDLQRTELTGKDGAPLTVTTTALDDEA